MSYEEFCYGVRVPYNCVYTTDDGNLTREQVIKRIKAHVKGERLRGERLTPDGCEWDNAEVSEAKDDY